MQLVELSDLSRVEPRVEAIWQAGSEVHWQQAAPYCVVGLFANGMIKRHQESNYVLPPLGLYRIPDAQVHGRGCVSIGDTVLAGESWPGIAAPDRPAKRLLGATPKQYFSDLVPSMHELKISGRAVLLSHPADHIFGHWLLDIFPILWLAECHAAMDGTKVIIRSDAPSYIDTWLAAAGIAADDILRHDVSNEILQVEELIVGTHLRIKEYFYPEMSGFGDWFKGIHVKDPEPPAVTKSRIYVSRSGVERPRRNMTNRLEIEGKFRDFGFELYHPESDTTEAQIRKFSNAEIIVGESGSGLHNSLFSPSDTIVCSLTSQKRLNLIQSALCQVRDQRVAYMIGVAFDRAGLGNTVDFYIAPEDIIDLLEQCRMA